MPKNIYRLTDETVHVLRIARVVWNSEASVTDRHLALPKRKCEEAEFIEETAHSLYREDTPSKCDLNIVNHYDDTGILIWVIMAKKNSPSHPNICLCCYELSTVEVDHLWCTVWQSSVPSFIKVMSFRISLGAKENTLKWSENSLFDFLLNNWHTVCLRVLEAISSTSEITKDIVSSVMQKNIFHLYEEDEVRPVNR